MKYLYFNGMCLVIDMLHSIWDFLFFLVSVPEHKGLSMYAPNGRGGGQVSHTFPLRITSTKQNNKKKGGGGGGGGPGYFNVMCL